VHFLDAWLDLSAFELLRLAVPLGLLAMPLFLPGPRPAYFAAFGTMLAVELAFRPHAPTGVVIGWLLLWAAIAWRVQQSPRAPRLRPERGAALEAGIIGLALGLALVLILIGAIAKQDLPAPTTRMTSYALAVIGLGLLQLMLRRHATRAALGFGTLGLGVQLLDDAARFTRLPGESHAAWTVLIGTAFTVALCLRIGGARERWAGSPWVNDAHLLHD